jgi:Spy/CpxP family protein refolding chaperone
MFRSALFALFAGLLVLTTGSFGQDTKSKEDPTPADKKDDKKDEPMGKLKGKLPNNWHKLGLSDKQIQDIYKVQAKYDPEIDKLEAKAKELKATRDKEARAVLTAEQTKHLEDILLKKDQ